MLETYCIAWDSRTHQDICCEADIFFSPLRLKQWFSNCCPQSTNALWLPCRWSVVRGSGPLQWVACTSVSAISSCWGREAPSFTAGSRNSSTQMGCQNDCQWDAGAGTEKLMSSLFSSCPDPRSSDGSNV